MAFFRHRFEDGQGSKRYLFGCIGIWGDGEVDSGGEEVGPDWHYMFQAGRYWGVP